MHPIFYKGGSWPLLETEIDRNRNNYKGNKGQIDRHRRTERDIRCVRYIYRKKDERARRNIEEEVRERDTDTVTVTEIRRVREIYREKYMGLP